MIVISANNLTKEYDGSNLVLDKVSFAVNKGERIGIIGINGAGKTTLLRMLTGQLPHDGGDFFVSSDLRLGYLEQDGGFDSENTVIEEVNKVLKESIKEGAANFKSDMKFTQESIDEIFDDAENKYDKKVEERIDDMIALYNEKYGK